MPIILNLLANRNIALIYSTTTAPLFSPLMFVGFHNQSPLLCSGETNNENTYSGDPNELSKFILYCSLTFEMVLGDRSKICRQFAECANVFQIKVDKFSHITSFLHQMH